MIQIKYFIAPLLLISFLLGGCGSRTGQESYKTSTEKSEDTKIVDNIKFALRNDPFLNAEEIHIAIDRNIVQLSGFVKTQAEAIRAGQIASRQPNVKEVINHIIARSHPAYKHERGIAEEISPSR